MVKENCSRCNGTGRLKDWLGGGYACTDCGGCGYIVLPDCNECGKSAYAGHMEHCSKYDSYKQFQLCQGEIERY